MWHRIEPLADPRWDALIAQHPRSSIFHTRAWLGALRQVYGYAPIAYTTSPPGARLENAIVFCRVGSWLTGRRLVSLPFSDHCEPLLSGDEQLNSFLGQAEQLAAEERVRYLELRPVCSSPAMASFPPHRTYCFHQIDLTPPAAVLFGNLQRDSIQRKIRRAERERLICRSGTAGPLFDDFWKLFLTTRRRHAAPPPPKAWFCAVLAAFGEDAALRIAYHEERPVAAILTLRSRETMVYKYGCSDPGWNQLGGTQLLLWTSIEAARQDGCAIFDLGRSDADAAGLIQFKDRWGASKSVLSYYRFPVTQSHALPATSRRGWPERLIRSAFCRLPDNLFAAAGRILYRHIG